MKPSIPKTLLFAPLAAVPAPAWATNEAPARLPVAAGPSTQEYLTVESRRLDSRIQADVIEAVLNVPEISGKIGVESNDAVVTLTGHTMTNGMAMRAARAAGR